MIFLHSKNYLLKFATTLFCVLGVWWVAIFFRGMQSGHENDAYTLIYPLLSLLGGIIGVISARRWGGMQSVFGRSIYFLALGLLAQFFGQAMYAYYIYIVGIEVPYPSLGDIGYFGSVILYAIALIALARVAAVRMSLKSIGGKLQVFILPAIVLAVSYFFFLRDYIFDWGQPVTIFLDFGYPLGQALYVSIAILILLLSRNALGGMMRGPIRFLILALTVQYFCDFMFLYQASHGTWYVGGVNDFLYSTSYILMTYSLAYIGHVFERIEQS